MPIYEYLCESCHKQVEVMQKFSDPAPAACEACGKGPMVKQLSMTSFALKGTGWYVTDFKGGTSKPASSEDKKANDSATPADPKTAVPSPAPAKTTGPAE